jgi:hypothetical protein
VIVQANARELDLSLSARPEHTETVGVERDDAHRLGPSRKGPLVPRFEVLREHEQSLARFVLE